MKKISILIAFIGISAAVFTACNNEAKASNEVAKVEHGDRKGSPHGDRKGPPHGDRKGPPHGGSPEQTRTIAEIGGYNIGEVASDFNLKNIDGKMFSMSDIKNAKGYIVTFTCNECPFAKLYEDRLIALHHKYAAKGYSVIAINSNSPDNEMENYEAMQKRAKEKNFPFVYLVDEGSKVYPKYGAVRTPHVFLLDQYYIVQYIGAIDDNAKSPEDVKEKFLENAIVALEKGEKPIPNLTKAIGCPIKPSKG